MKQQPQEMHEYVEAFDAILNGACMPSPTQLEVMESLELAATPGHRSLVAQEIPGGVLEESIDPSGWIQRMASLSSNEVVRFVTETGDRGTRKDLEDRLDRCCNGVGFADVVYSCLFHATGESRISLRDCEAADRLRIAETLETLAREHERAATQRMHNHEGLARRPDDAIANVLWTAGFLRCMSRGVVTGRCPERLE